MTKRYRWAAFLAATVGCLLVAGSTGAIAPEVRDDGKFFNPAALKKADEVIREIYRHHDRDVLVETFASLPGADREKLKAMDAAKRGAFFLQWAKDRAKDRVVNGVYVLICREPRHLLVGVHETQPHKFAAGTSDAIENLLRKEFKDGKFDEGLEQALKLIEEKLSKQ
jgi:hypothetical protein